MWREPTVILFPLLLLLFKALVCPLDGYLHGCMAFSLRQNKNKKACFCPPHYSYSGTKMFPYRKFLLPCRHFKPYLPSQLQFWCYVCKKWDSIRAFLVFFLRKQRKRLVYYGILCDCWCVQSMTESKRLFGFEAKTKGLMMSYFWKSTRKWSCFATICHCQQHIIQGKELIRHNGFNLESTS